jgi:ADP-ribosylglycohydrolase
MIGAITGDIVGSIYEHHNIKTKEFPLFGEGCHFTDDTVCTFAVADCLLDGGDFADYLRLYARRYPDRGYGAMFQRWAGTPNMGPYNSWGNGAAMRVSAVPYFVGSEAELFELAERQAAVTHNHPDAITGAQAVALTTMMAKSGIGVNGIRQEITKRFGYDLSRSVDDIRPNHIFDVSCAGTAPTAIICALAATDYEDAVRNAISLGGDSDTLACIAGGIAEAIFGVPEKIAATARGYLNDELNAVVKRFLIHIGS